MYNIGGVDLFGGGGLDHKATIRTSHHDCNSYTSVVMYIDKWVIPDIVIGIYTVLMVEFCI